ncbi:hypothetical protein [Streptomyces sp. NPDC090025]|uniref:hypothetical protein n=1 Tax=Streptomyces sp. NPDC090025 TaxID=3365922 RepID=UPI0038387C72
MTDREPVTVLEFSDDIHTKDVDPLREFLHERLAELVARQAPGTEAAWAAERLLKSTDWQSLFLSDLANMWSIEVHAGRAHRAGLTQRLRQDLLAWWNELCRTAEQFADHPDHLPRWRPLKYLCVEHAEIAEQLTEGFSSGTYEHGAHP